MGGKTPFQRAQNSTGLGMRGDPDRWGASTTFSVNIPAGAHDTGYVLGQQLIRVQFEELDARTVDVIAKYKISGVELTDGPFQGRKDGFTGFGLSWTIGAGQSSFIWTSAAALQTAPYSWTAITERTHIVEGVLQNLVPVPGASLAITPVFRLVNDALGVAHKITIDVTALVAPRA